jgi:hypothetical protein
MVVEGHDVGVSTEGEREMRMEDVVVTLTEDSRK